MTTEATQTVDLRRIVKDPALQVRAKLDAAWVVRLADAVKAGQALEPIRIAVVDGTPHLIDGFHRAEAMEKTGLIYAEAIVTEMTRAQAQWAAAAANLKHGLPLKSKELRAVFRAYVASRQHIEGRSKLKTYEAIAKEIGKDRSTIFRWMVADFPKIAARIGGREPFEGSGGHRAVKPQTMRAGEGAIKALRDAFQATTDAGFRADLMAQAREAVKDMEHATDWRPIRDPTADF